MSCKGRGVEWLGDVAAQADLPAAAPTARKGAVFKPCRDRGAVEMITPELPPGSSLILYQTEDGRTRVQCRFEGESIWLTQALLEDLFQKDVRTINEHLQNIFTEGELSREATIRKFRIVRQEEA